jgi:acetyl esterase/lipase
MADSPQLDRHAKRFLKMLTLSGAVETQDVTARRDSITTLCEIGEDKPPTVVSIRDLVLESAAGELGARLYTSLDAAKISPGLIYLHGGGWVAGGLDTHDGLCRRLAQTSGCRILSIDYRLAPEHPFPAALDDTVAAVRWLYAHAREFDIDPSRIGLAGDSAGGALAAAAAHLVSEQGPVQVALLVLICPILDIARESASRQALAEGYFLDSATMAADLACYLPPGCDRADPRLSPLLTPNLGGLPHTLVHSAQFDPFHDEAEAFAERLRGAGVPVQHTDHPGMIHYFYALPRAIPYAREAAEQIGREIAEAFGPMS